MELAVLKCSRHRLDRRRCSTVMGYLRVHRRAAAESGRHATKCHVPTFRV